MIYLVDDITGFYCIDNKKKPNLAKPSTTLKETPEKKTERLDLVQCGG